ncbi:hypothetical protein [Streptomyces sp. B15]|uniref:hypothetical protein n=1 Tax=Streptomyces sp. B15 TaxID=1537797 RepID=UPI001B390894|nr:hypothetical protein [Streptomyces sp. B15]MBQ1124287.1 hypothetical protein [Streptomyces sp. B15]
MIHIKNCLDDIQTFVDQRLRRLRGTLKDYEERTVHCPACEQLALVADGKTNRCHFCGLVVTTTQALINFYLFGHPEPESQVKVCPQCTQPTVVKNVPVATGECVAFCFGCPGPIRNQSDNSTEVPQ